MIRKLTLAAALIPLAFTSIPAEATPVHDGSQIQNSGGGDFADAMNFTDSTPGTSDPDTFVGVLSTLWSMTQFDQEGTNGQNPLPGQGDRPTQVPEPGMLALLGAGLVGLTVLRRRKRA